MKSILYIICLIAAINANMQNELDLVYKHYDAMVDIAEIKYGGNINCETEINDLMDLLCDGFQYCSSNGDCMDKIEYQQFVTNYCDLYQQVDYSIYIKPNNQYIPTYTSLTCKWTFLTTDGCTMKVNERHKLYYNDEGLITKFYDELISEHTECPQSGYNSDSDPEPTVKYPQETAYLGENYRGYSNIRPVQIAGGDPNYNGFNKVTNPTELEYINADLVKLQDIIAEAISTELAGVSLIDAYSKHISKNQIRYRCRTELEEDGPNHGKDDGIFLRIYIEYDAILITKSQETNGYIEDEPSTTPLKYSRENEYIEDEPSSTADECQNNADGINKFFEAVPVTADDCGKDGIDHLMALFSDDFTYNEVEDGIEYTLNKTQYEQAVLKSCHTYKTADYALSPISCNSVTVEWKLTFIDGCTLTKMDEQEFVFDSQGLITRKRSRIISESSIICPPPTEYEAEPSTTPPKYAEENEYIEEPKNEYKPQATTAYGSALTTKYPQNEYDATKLAKNDIISGLVDHFDDVLCKSKQGKAEDGINVFCDDAEYDAICDNEADDDACEMFAGSIPGRDGVLQYFKQYEDIFDEATSRYDFSNDRLITSYRKGSCQGEYSQRVEFEYDEQRQCISKWIDYLGDIITSDKGCHNSAAAFNRKILIECKFDDEIDNEYIKDEPSTTSGYESETEFDTTVNGYEECEPVTTRAYEGSPMLRKKEREMKVKAFYEAAFECRLKRNRGNTKLLDTFMDYFGDSAELCIVEDNACYNKNELREAMEYTDDEDLIDYQVEIMSNDACKIESKCVSHRRKSNGCIVTKEEYDTCLFNKDGTIKQFTVKRSISRIDCDYNDNE